MKMLVVALALLISSSSTAIAQNYPKEIPQNFENAPLKASCSREEPTPIGLKHFVHPREKWTVQILSRNSQEISLVFTLYPSSAELSLTNVVTPGILEIQDFMLTTDGWKVYDELTNSEKESLESSTDLSSEEIEFLVQCVEKQAKNN